jgi:hypothetical protein
MLPAWLDGVFAVLMLAVAAVSTARLAAARPVALLIAAAGTAGLLVAAWSAHDLHLGSPLIEELPASSPVARAGAAAADGFAPGILSPTEILVIGPGVAKQTAALARLQQELADQPGVAERTTTSSWWGASGKRPGAGRYPTPSLSPRRKPRARSPRLVWPWRLVSPCWP